MNTKTATIIYHSKRGTTQKFAAEIAFYLKSRGIETKVTSITKFKAEDMDGADFIFFGCWTSGLFLILQHPEKEWVEFINKLPKNLSAKTALFTTYKVRTGSMFSNMKKYLKLKTQEASLLLQSRNGELSELNKDLISQLIDE